MSARDFALYQLDRLRLPGFKTAVAKRIISVPADPRDVGLAEQIRVGVLKNLGLLNYLIDHYTDQRRSIDPLVRKILAIGIYQFRFLTRIPASAVVDEAVEQAKRFGRRHSSGFVNAILRRAIREPDVPLPNAKDDPKKYAEIALSHPPELIDRFMTLGDAAWMLKLCAHNNFEPPTIVRAFESCLDFPSKLSSDSIRLTPHEQPGMFVIDGAHRSDYAAWAQAGIAQVQDPTAALVAVNMSLSPGLDVLDRCAGLGTKTLQMHDLMQGQGWLMAIDPAEARCAALKLLAQQRGITNLAVVQAGMLQEIREIKRPAFDRILLDVPCSNSGVMARRPEARYSQTQKSLASLTELQSAILKDSAPYIRRNGLMVYSTCSIWREENENRIESFLASHAEFELVGQTTTLPSLENAADCYRDGGYFAVIRRS